VGPDELKQVVLQPLQPVQEQHADRGEGQHAAQVGAPRLVDVRVDAGQLEDAALHPPVLVGGEDARDVVAERDAARGERGDQQGNLQPSCESAVHLEPLRQHERNEQVDGQQDTTDEAEPVVNAQSARPP
jgi:hypothetical protein